MVGVVGAQGHLTQVPNVPNPRTKYKRSKKVFSVTTCAHHWPRLAAIGTASCAVCNRESRESRVNAGTNLTCRLVSTQIDFGDPVVIL